MSKSDDDSFIKIKQQLDKVSSSFCLAKWKQVTLHLQNGTTHSCHHPAAHAIDKSQLPTNPSALHNTDFKKLTRKQMKNGQRPQECNYCWDIEDQQGMHISDRYIKSGDKSFINDSDIETISKLDWDANINPSYVEVSFSNTCNLKCAYCSPVHSSKWHQEIKQDGAYPLFGKRELHSLERLEKVRQTPMHSNELNPYTQAFWSWWPSLIKSLKVLRKTKSRQKCDT